VSTLKSELTIDDRQSYLDSQQEKITPTSVEELQMVSKYSILIIIYLRLYNISQTIYNISDYIISQTIYNISDYIISQTI